MNFLPKLRAFRSRCLQDWQQIAILDMPIFVVCVCTTACSNTRGLLLQVPLHLPYCSLLQQVVYRRIRMNESWKKFSAEVSFDDIDESTGSLFAMDSFRGKSLFAGTECCDRTEESSPTSIAAAMDTLAGSSLCPYRSEVVAMGETGAEVTLDLASLRLLGSSSILDDSSPKKQSDTFASPEELPALFDGDTSPSPMLRRTSSIPVSYTYASEMHTPGSPQNVALCGLPSCCNPTREVSPFLIQAQISRFLESPAHSNDDWCHGWQAWSFFQMGGSPDIRDNTNEQTLKSQVQRILRGRALDLSARRERLATLRTDLSPFRKTRIAPVLTRSQSFTIAATKKHRATAPPSLTSVWGCGSLDCTIPETTTVSPRKLEEGYDSDPEDFARTRSRHSKTRSSSLDKENRFERISSNLDDDHERMQVAAQQMMNDTLTLILHENSMEKMDRSYAVSAWIERGQMFSSGVVLAPKLVFARRRNNAVQSSCSIELLDVHRILDIKKIDRKRHPFARPERCFEIKTIHDSIVLEARSPGEKHRIMKSLKLVISRLASMLIVSDAAMVDEFFLTTDSNGPGEEPKWLEDQGFV